MSHSDLVASIAAERDRLGLAVSPEAMPGLAAYAASLWAWNEKLNLTRHTDVEKFVSRDVADAVAIAPHLARGERLLDVGTGGGTPGVILALLRPDLRVELIDSVAKKARAVREIVRETGLDIPVHEGSAQALVAVRPSGPQRFDTLVVRAVAPLAKLLGWFEPICDAYGRMLVVKGPRWDEEKTEALFRGLVRKVTVRRIASWPIPGSDNESVLLEIAKRSMS
ncbi:MAG: 16S rRNA (guanine(527)-N(7))-methyltransferase RsmG [Planctomycetia bacterium]|nr:16S rRNA (guanine(527)-N(7))-methyltransferase RsmG [Planctomycetia bacterium]